MSRIHIISFGCWVTLSVSLWAPPSAMGQIISSIRIDSRTEGMEGVIQDFDRFGSSLVSLGDVDGDGWPELAVGAPGRDRAAGLLHILFLGQGGSIRNVLSFDHDSFEPDGTRRDDQFGASVAMLSRIMPGPGAGGGGFFLAVGAPGRDQEVGGSLVQGMGEVYFVRVTSDVPFGQASSTDIVINATTAVQGNQPLIEQLTGLDNLGRSLANLGDADGDGTFQLAVGIPGYDEPVDNSGGVVVFSLPPAFTAGESEGFEVFDLSPQGFTSSERASFGWSLASFRDLGADGVGDLFAGAHTDGANGAASGSLVLSLVTATGELRDQRRLSLISESFDFLGSSVASAGDVDGDGLDDLVVGAWGRNGGRGDVWFVPLDDVGQPRNQVSLTEAANLQLATNSNFGAAVDTIDDLDGNETREVVAGGPSAPGGGNQRGSIWVLFTHPPQKPSVEAVRISPEVQPTPTSDITISAAVRDDSGVESVQLNVRRGGDPSFAAVAMSAAEGDAYRYDVPPVLLSDRGIDYFVVAVNSGGIPTRFPEDGYLSLPFYLPDGDETTLTTGNEERAYRLVSFPLQLDSPSARDMLESSLGRVDPLRWRFFGQVDGTLRDVSVTDFAIAPGFAYWALVRDGVNSTMSAGPGTTIRTDSEFEIPMVPGWNLIGNPFHFSVPFSRLRTGSGQPIDARSYVNGVWSEETERLVPFAGYAVFNGAGGTDTLIIDPDLSDVVAAELQAQPPSPEVALHIGVVGRMGGSVDGDNAAIVSPEAAIGLDRIDRTEPPTIGEYVSVSFEGPDSARPLNVDARPHAELIQWPIVVSASRAGRAELTFSGLDALSSDQAAWLMDEENDVVLELTPADATYPVPIFRPRERRTLKLIVGDAGRLSADLTTAPESSERYEILGTYPNPMGEAVTIRYSLGRPAASVRLSVSDVLGRRVAIVSERAQHPAGTFADVWDGRTPANSRASSGVYVLQLEVDGKMEDSRPVIVIRP